MNGFVVMFALSGLFGSAERTTLPRQQGRVLADIGNLRALVSTIPRPMSWCEGVTRDVVVDMWVETNGPYDAFDVQRLLKQAGAVIEPECPLASRLSVNGISNDRRVWTRHVREAQGCHLSVPGEDQHTAVGKSVSKALTSDNKGVQASLTAKAEAGDARAQYGLGLFLLYSAHDSDALFKPDPVAAARWFQKAADQHLPAAIYMLGRLHMTGQGVPMNDRTAWNFIEAAAKLGHSPAMVALGNELILSGNRHLAPPWLQKAADLGDAEAFNTLAALHHAGPNADGVGFPKDYGKAMAFYQRAAADGSCLAYKNIGGLYFNGDMSRKRSTASFPPLNWRGCSTSQSFRVGFFSPVR